MLPKVIVYSCVTAGYDDITQTLLSSAPTPEENVTFVLFTDNPPVGDTGVWGLRPLTWNHAICPRRSARYHKCMTHKVLPEHDYSVWVDGSQIFKGIKVWEDLLRPQVDAKCDLATFKHPLRQCVYQEEKACERHRKDNVVVMRDQMLRYKAAGYPVYHGMVETACVIRANTSAIHAFNSAWWSEISSDSFRDQLSFNYTCWTLQQEYGQIPGHREKSPFFNFVSHKR
jgi:hypothetical protein